MRRRCVLLLLAPLALLSTPATAAAPMSYDAQATAVGTRAQSTQSPTVSVVTADLVDSTAAFATSALSTSTTPAASAAAVYPGDLVSGGPILLCEQLLPCPTPPPPYPLLASASWPDAPSGSATGASATAAQRAAAATAGVTDPVAQPAGLRVASADVTTRTWVDAQGCHAQARSTLNDVSLGVLHIAGLTSEVRVDVTAAGAVHSAPSVVVGAVTVAGQAASLDDRGVHVAGTDASTPARSLAEQGLAVSLIGTSDERRSGVARATAGGIRIDVWVPVQGVPPLLPGLPGLNRTYLGSITVGGAGVFVSAGSTPLALPQPLPVAPAGSLPRVLLPGTTPVPPVAAPAAGVVAPAVPVGRHEPRYLWRRLVDPLPDLTPVALLLLVLPPSVVLVWRAVVGARRTRT